jgi:hypothetical protein
MIDLVENSSVALRQGGIRENLSRIDDRIVTSVKDLSCGTAVNRGTAERQRPNKPFISILNPGGVRLLMFSGIQVLISIIKHQLDLTLKGFLKRSMCHLFWVRGGYLWGGRGVGSSSVGFEGARVTWSYRQD